jgi:hypothetical protein
LVCWPWAETETAEGLGFPRLSACDTHVIGTVNPYCGADNTCAVEFR